MESFSIIVMKFFTVDLLVLFLIKNNYIINVMKGIVIYCSSYAKFHAVAIKA